MNKWIEVDIQDNISSTTLPQEVGLLPSQVRCWVSVLVNPPWLSWKRLKTNTPLKTSLHKGIETGFLHQADTHSAAKVGWYSWSAACRWVYAVCLEAWSHTWSPDQTETKIPFSFSECVSTTMFSILKLNKGWEGFLLYCRDKANKKMWQRNIWEALVSLHTFNKSSCNAGWICRTNAASSVRGTDLLSTVSGILAVLGEERTGQVGVSTTVKCMSASKE